MRKFQFTILAGLAVAALASAGPAAAADLVLKAPPAPAWSWTGFYAGINAGSGYGRAGTDATFLDSTTGAVLAVVSDSIKFTGALAGIQAGYNWQLDRMIAGVEADAQWSNQRGSGTFLCPTACSPNGPVYATLDPSLKWLATFRGRLGVAFAPAMAYVTGGVAYGGLKNDGTFHGWTGPAAPISGTFTNSTDRVGWTIGGGFEAALPGNWTAKVEYLHVDLGTWLVVPPTVAGNFRMRITDDIVRVGLNYKLR